MKASAFILLFSTTYFKGESFPAPGPTKKSIFKPRISAPKVDLKSPDVDLKKVDLKSLSPVDIALCGSFATMFSETALLPIDCIKTLQQSTQGMGMSLFDAGGEIYRSHGISGFYFGLGSNLVGNGCAGALKFATYETLKAWVTKRIPEQYTKLSLFACAAMAFVTSSIFVIPGELLKQKLQMGQIGSLAEGIVQIWRAEGLMGFFHGASGVYMRDIPYTMLQLGLYDLIKNFRSYLKNKHKSKKEKVSQADEIAAAAIVGGLTGFLTSPLDNIKTKLTVDGHLYKGFFDCIRKCVEDQGIASLFAGSVARTLWLVPATILYLQTYETMKRLLSKQYNRFMEGEGDKLLG